MIEIKSAIRAFILREFLASQGDAALQDETPLLDSGVMDSLSALSLVAFLEETFEIEMQAKDLSRENLADLNHVAAFVAAKLGRSAA